MLKLAWLGSPLVEVAGGQLHFETRKIIALLAYLSLNPKGNQREKLATLLWPEFDQAHALANLRRALGSLNRSLGLNCIESNRDTIKFDESTPIEIDILELRVKIQSVRTHDHEDPERCIFCLKQLEEASGHYRGDFLEGLNLPDCPEFDEWQYFLREELKHDLAWMFQRLENMYTSIADWEKAATIARKWVRLDRLDADAQLALASIYMRSNQRNLALRQAEEYARYVKEELGQDLDKETRERFQQLINQPGSARMESQPVQREQAQNIHALLKNKLYLPKLKPNRVNRPRLISRLAEIPNYKLTLISAPAGFGKTCLLAEWAAQPENQAGWLSLDSGDNDPARFFAYLCAVFDNLVDGLGHNAQSMLESPQPIEILSLIAVLLNDVTKVRDPLVIVLDDYQFITSKAIHDAVTYVLDHAGPNFHLVLASRADPPLPLARLRLQGDLLEVRTDDLRFTLEEAVSFFNQTMRLDITPEDTQALAGRAEGWAVGLQMAAISLQGSHDRGQFIRTFSGSHRYILDYLIQEVLEQQQESVRDFLMKTALLQRFCVDLCDFVVGESAEPAYQTLDYIERSNLFIIPLDEERTWYRYHHLFADLLVTQLQRNHPQLLPELHSRASRWFEKEGLIDEAIEHALAAKDMERFSDLVEKDAQRLAYRIEFSKMQKWIGLLPHEFVMKKAWIAITQGWLMLVSGQIQPLADLIKNLREYAETLWVEQYSADEQNDIAANITSLQAYIFFFAGDPGRSIEMANQALDLISPQNDALRVRLFVQIGESYLIVHELPRAIDFLYRAVDLGIPIHDYQSTTTATMRMYRTLRLLGRLNEAETLVHRVLKALSDAGRTNSPVSGKPEICWGDLLRERGQLEAAKIQLDQGLFHARQYNIPYDIVTAIIYKVKWFYSQRRWAEAWSLLDEALPILNTRSIPPVILQSWALWRATVALEKGDLPEVEKYLGSQQMHWDDTSIYPKEEEYILLARYLLRQGKLAETTHLLENLRKASEEKERYGNLVPIYLLEAMTYFVQGQLESALAYMEKCLAIGFQEGYHSTILDEDQSVPALLKAFRMKGLSQPFAAYVDSLLYAFEERNHQIFR